MSYLFAYNSYGQANMAFNVFVGIDASLEQKDTFDIYRNKLIPNIGISMKYDGVFFMSLGFSCYFDNLLVIKDEAQLGINLLRIFNKRDKYKLYLIPICTRFNFTDHQFYDDFTWLGRVEFQRKINKNQWLSIFVEKHYDPVDNLINIFPPLIITTSYDAIGVRTSIVF